MMPWRLFESSEGYIFTWLTGYGALLGPVLGVMLADYWLVRRGQLDVPALFDMHGRYAYRGGWNPAAVIALVLGVIPNVPGFLHTAFPRAFPDVGIFADVYKYAWFVGVLVSMTRGL